MKVDCRFFFVLFGMLLIMVACDNGNSGSDNGNEDGDDADSGICADTDECPSGQYCDLETNTCKPYEDGDQNESDCAKDEDCSEGYVCDDGICIPDQSVDGDDGDGDSVDGDEVEQDFDVRCDDYLPCTEDTYNGSECVYTIKDGYCLIAEACYPAGKLKDGTQCMACRPEVATDDWSNVENGTSCDDSAACTTYDSCLNGECKGGARDCSDDVDCTDDTCQEPNGCINAPVDANCPGDQTCDPVNGCVDGCTFGDFRCIGDELQECDNSGDWQFSDLCSGNTPVCTIANGCVECSPGESKCEGNMSYVCSDAGVWESQYCLGPDPACISGECSACTNGGIWCGHDGMNDWGIYECVNGEWSLVEDCEGDTPMCGDTGDGVVCLECSPGTYRCDGLSHQVCDENGIWQVDPCPGDKPYCDKGRCVTCLDGDTRCGDPEQSENLSDLYVCVFGDEDNYWVFSETCPASAPNCSDGVCESCTPGDTRCGVDPQTVEICDDDGLWVYSYDCVGGNFCDPETGECTDGWSLEFDGESKMEIPDNNEYDPNAEFTIEAWIYPTQLTGNCDSQANTVVEKWAAWPVGTYMISVCDDFYGHPNVARFFAITDSDKQDYLNSSDNSIDVNAWNHLAVVWADDRIDLYVNGVREAHHSNLIGWKTPNTYEQNVLAVGRLDDKGGWGFFGYIDEVRVSKVARYDGESYTPEMYFHVDDLTTGLWHFDDFLDTNECIDAAGFHDGDNAYGASYDELGVGESAK